METVDEKVTFKIWPLPGIELTCAYIQFALRYTQKRNKISSARNFTKSVNQPANSDWRSLQIFQLTKRPKIKINSLHASEMHMLFKFLADRGQKRSWLKFRWRSTRGFREKVFHPTVGMIVPMWMSVFSFSYNTIEIQRKDSRRLEMFLIVGNCSIKDDLILNRRKRIRKTNYVSIDRWRLNVHRTQLVPCAISIFSLNINQPINPVIVDRDTFTQNNKYSRQLSLHN